jgi:adenylate cyclase
MTMRSGSVPLREIAECFEGIVPSWICTCSRDGVPNVTNLSIVHLVDDTHVGLSVQFFNKTRRNILENPRARVLVVSPDMLRQYRLDLQFDHTESSGPLFERMRSRLDAIASQSGMRDIFRLRGVDVYEVLECRPPDAAPHQHVADSNAVGAMTAFTTEISKCRDLDSLLTKALEQLEICFGCAHSFVMVRDETGRRLYTLTSRGFPDSGVGSEVVVGEGLIGSAADRRMPVRTTHLSRDRIYANAIRQEVARAGDAGRLVEETPVPGLPDLQSQLVLPLEARNELLGVLCLQSSRPGHFLSADEERMQIVARHVAASLAAVGFGTTDAAEASNVSMPPLRTAGSSATVRYYPADDSVFIDDVYLTKGVPGRIFYRLLQMYVQQRRQDFTNKEIRLDPALKLPDFQANLEARLILLRRRLEERTEAVRLEHAGRGKLRLAVMRPLAIKVES